MVWINIILNKISPDPEKSLHKDWTEKKFYYWISINPESDALHKHSAKRLFRQKEISPFYKAKQIQSICTLDPWTHPS